MIRILSVLLTLLLVHSASAEDEGILDIRRQFNRIESANLSTRTLKAGDEASPVTLTRHSWGKQQPAAKIAVESLGDHGITTEFFYYDEEGRLFFAFVVSEWWQFTGKQKADGESETIDRRRETRLYYAGDRCLRALVKEVKDPDPGQLQRKIAKEPNREFTDPELAESLRAAGLTYQSMRNREDLEKHLAR